MRPLALALALALLPLGLGLGLSGCSGGTGTRNVKSTGPREAPKLDPVKPQARREFEAALRALRLGGPESVETARARFEAAVAIDGKLWEGYHDLGVLRAQDGDDDGAVTAFGKALSINPAHAPTRLARAESMRRLGRVKEARADYEATLRETAEDDPLRRDAAARLASLLRDNRDFEGAVDVLRDTLRVSGANARVYIELCNIYMAQNRDDLAVLVIGRAIELDPKDPTAYNALALLYLKQGKAQEAFDRFDYATSLDPGYSDARFNKASVLLDAGDYTRAKQELETIIQKAPEDWAAHVSLGVAWRGLKENANAKKKFELVIDKAPRRSRARGDALWNLAVLKSDFLEDTAGAKADLERFLQDAGTAHPKRQAAELKRKELGI
jgi:tetratricopeptide (TPR) repeat protein